MATGYRNPAHWSTAPARTGVEFFSDEAKAIEHHEAMKAAGRKPRKTRLIDHRKPDGAPVYSWKVETRN